MRICKTLGEDSQGFERLWERSKDSWDFGRGFARTVDFGRGFARIRETLGEDLQGFMRLWEGIHKDS